MSQSVVIVRAMTQWSDGRPPGSVPAGPSPQYEPPAYQAPYAAPAYGASGYGAPGYGSPYGPGARAPRETGAMVTCIVLLVAAVIASFIASAAVFGTLTDDSSAQTPAVPNYGSGTAAGGGGAAAGGGGAAAGGGGAAAGGGATQTPQAGKRNFPVYPGARRIVGSTARYRADGQIATSGTHYLAPKSVNSVYLWYGKHLGRAHLKYGYLSKTIYRGTNTLAYLFGSIETVSDNSTVAEFDLQPGRQRGTCVITAHFYG